jgi:hypothetical protein
MARGNLFGTDGPLDGTSASVVADFDTDPSVTGSADGGIKAADSDADSRKTLYYAAGTIVAALIALWAFGGIVFKDANL